MKEKKPRTKKDVLTNAELEFLENSNWIEGEYSKDAFKDAQLAWAYGKHFKETMSVSHILHIHKILMGRLRPDIAGQWRKVTVWIGGVEKPARATYTIEQDVDNWIEMMYKRESMDTKRSHVAFEDIHPFEDGNGRVGRILYNLERLTKGEDLHIIHEGDEQMEYYKWFKK